MPRFAAEAPPRDFLLERFPKWTLAHWCTVVAAVSFLVLATLPEARLNDFDVPTGGESVRIARSLAFHGTFADPFATIKTGVTAHIAPAYPFLYSLVLRLFGTHYTALLILWAASLACLALQLGLLPLLSHRLHREKRSEEHTSELQSQSNLVCRLLLEKKKQPTLSSTTISFYLPQWVN